jgi:hypothetical protein
MTQKENISLENKKALLLASPIEFALIGPSGGRDKVLLRSPNVGLDLIGLAAEGADWKKRRSSTDILALIFGGTKQLNIVASFPIADTNPNRDGRPSEFSFVWKGFASNLGIERVERTLNLQLPHLYLAIKGSDISEIEWAIAPIIYQCTKADERRMRFRRTLLATIALYVSVGILAAIFSGALLLQRFIISIFKVI